MQSKLAVLFAAALYFASSWVQAPVDRSDLAGGPHIQAGQLALGPPTALSGDPPHYLAMVRSLVEDGDFDVSDEYRQARQGSLDAGVRFRRRTLDAHADRDAQGRLVPTHTPGFAALLAAFVWPFAGTFWMEPWCIWMTLLAGIGTLALLARRTEEGFWILLLGLASPLWCYSRDLWTEAWVALAWLALATTRRPLPGFLLGVAGTLIKYPFAVVPMAMGAVDWIRGERKRGAALMASALAGLAAAVAWAQWLFRDVEDHFSLLHSGIHGGFGWPLDGLAGLLLDPQAGLLFFFPVFLWAARPLWREKELLWPAAAFFLLHAAYDDWGGGTGFSARYLVPALPVAVLAMSRHRLPRSRVFLAAAAYSLFWGAMGGLAPALPYDRTPWGVFLHIFERLSGSMG